MVMQNGDAIIRRNKLSAGLINIWGRGIKYDDILSDALYDVMKQMPPRPTISAMQWIKGTPIATIEDVDVILGGPRRPKSKQTLEQEKSQREQQALIQRQSLQRSNTQSSSTNGPLGSISNALDSLEETTNQYLNSLSETVNQNQSQTSIMKSVFKAKFF